MFSCRDHDIVRPSLVWYCCRTSKLKPLRYDIVVWRAHGNIPQGPDDKKLLLRMRLKTLFQAVDTFTQFLHLSNIEVQLNNNCNASSFLGRVPSRTPTTEPPFLQRNFFARRAVLCGELSSHRIRVLYRAWAVYYQIKTQLFVERGYPI